MCVSIYGCYMGRGTIYISTLSNTAHIVNSTHGPSPLHITASTTSMRSTPYPDRHPMGTNAGIHGKHFHFLVSGIVFGPIRQYSCKIVPQPSLATVKLCSKAKITTGGSVNVNFRLVQTRASGKLRSEMAWSLRRPMRETLSRSHRSEAQFETWSFPGLPKPKRQGK